MAKVPVTRAQIIADLQRVAAELKRVPSRDEYVSRGTDGVGGKITQHAIRESFGAWADLVDAAGLGGSKSKVRDVTSPDGLHLAKAQAEISRLNSYIKDLERETVTATSLRGLIGSADTTELGGGADWLKGPRDAKASVTGIPTLFLSDIHFDEVVRAEEVNFVNEYNHEIAVRRIKHTFQTAVDLTKRYMMKPKYDGFVLALGGDMFSGNIHEELAETNDQAIMRSILDLSDLLAAGIEGLADEFGRVFVPCVVGNHGRLHKKPRYKLKVEQNYEWLLYQFLSRHFKNNSKVSFLIPDAPDAQWSVYSKVYNLNHGDQFKGGSGISGIFTPLMLGMARKQKKQNAVGKPFDIMLNGHWHQLIMTNSLIVNSSIKGYDEFANGHNFPYEPAQQALWISHPTKGEIYRMPVLCDAVPYLKAKSKTTLTW